MRVRRSTSSPSRPPTFSLKWRRPWPRTHSSRVWGSPSCSQPSAGTSLATIGSRRPTVCRTATVSGAGRLAHASRSARVSSRCTASGRIPSTSSRSIPTTSRPVSRPAASASARSNREEPKAAVSPLSPSAGPPSAQAAYASCHTSKTDRGVRAASRYAACAARMDASWSVTLSRKLLAGSLSNHFGGRLSAAKPRARRPSAASTSTARWSSGKWVSVTTP